MRLSAALVAATLVLSVTPLADAQQDSPTATPPLQATAPDGPAADAPQVWIVQPAGGPSALPRLIEALREMDVHHHAMPLLGMATFLGSSSQAQRLTAQGHAVEPDRPLDLHLDRSVEYIEADAVKKALGPVRDGPVVLVVDTGVDSAHPDFQQTLVANIQPEVEGGLVVGDLAQQPVVDPAGHGTHVGGIVAGTGAGFGDGTSGKYRGVYSNGRLASYQVTLDAPGSEDPQVDTAAALQAFEWTLANRNRFDIQVVTNSWGAPGPFDPQAAVNQATLRLYEAGIVVVFSAGNEGRNGENTLNKYCMAPWVLCVAAGDFGGARAPFSSMGAADAPYKHPDLTAPGDRITSAQPVSSMGGGLTARQALGENLYSARSGTSMAAPHVAAAAALLLAGNPALSPDQVMDILVGTTDPMADDVERVGSGYLNARTAYNMALVTEGGRTSFLNGGVKYAGPATGDSTYSVDPVTAGGVGAIAGTTVLPAPEEPVWLLSSVVAWVLSALVVLSLVSGIQWRKPRPAPERAHHPQRIGRPAAQHTAQNTAWARGTQVPASAYRVPPGTTVGPQAQDASRRAEPNDRP